MPPAPPTAPIDICNLALDHIGQREIASIDAPTTVPEDVCARWYPQTRRQLLREYVFNFAKKYAILTSDLLVTPAFGFATSYLFPNDFIRLLALGDVTVNADTPAGLFDISDGHIFTDEGETEGLKLHYIFDAQNITRYDPLFIDLFALQLASNVAYKFTLKPSIVMRLAENLKAARLSAAAVAGQEKPPRRIQRSRVRDVRRRGGSWHDPTRIP